MARRKSSKADKQGAEASGAITDAGARGISKALGAATGDSDAIPGPSTNPATNLIIHDVLMRSGGRLLRHTIEKGVLANRYGGRSAKKIIENRSLGQALLGSLVARVATRSLPGAALVGGGLVVKTLYDRSRGKRQARRAGDMAMKNAEKK
jgi:hypothetical protein